METMKTLLTLCVLLQLRLQRTTAQFEIEVDETAPYTVTNEAEAYEERVYQAANWVCHEDVRQSYSPRGQKKSFFALFRYITGSNDAEMEIAMTAPVTMLKQSLEGGLTRYQMCFYLPKIHQANPPVPLDAEVYIEQRPKLTVVVRTFGGFAMRESQWESQARELQRSLKEAQEPNVDFSGFYRCGYDAPIKLQNRRNEVWFAKNV